MFSSQYPFWKTNRNKTNQKKGKKHKKPKENSIQKEEKKHKKKEKKEHKPILSGKKFPTALNLSVVFMINLSWLY